MLISDGYQALLKKHREKNPRWGFTGYSHKRALRAFADKHDIKTSLDYGCGAGSLKACLYSEDPKTRIKWSISEYDPSVSGKDKPPKGVYDMVICTDVLEHVEEVCVHDVLDDIYRLSGKCAYLAISLIEAKEILPDGRGAHITLKTSGEWLSLMFKFDWTHLRVARADRMLVLECEK